MNDATILTEPDLHRGIPDTVSILSRNQLASERHLPCAVEQVRGQKIPGATLNEHRT